MLPRWAGKLTLICYATLLHINLICAAKLACQQRPITSRLDGVVPTTSPSTTSAQIATVSTFPSSVTVAPSYVKANLCCGSRPFNSDVSVCCMGRVLRKTARRCCLDGKHAPWESRCFCYPASTWVIDEIDRLAGIEIQFTSLIEEMEATIEPLRQQIVAAEEYIELLDSKANALYQEFLVNINMTRNQDPAEAEYINELISFLIANEANVENARKKLSVLEQESMSLLDAVVQSEEEEYSSSSHSSSSDSSPTRSTDVLTSASLRRLRREIRSMNATVETAEKLMTIVRQEINENLPGPESNRQEAIRLTVERRNVMMNITRENRALSELRNRVSILTRIRNILAADRDLLVNLRQFLDSLLDLVLQMEAAHREENPEEEREEGRRRKKRASGPGSIEEAMRVILFPEGYQKLTDTLSHKNDVNETSIDLLSSHEIITSTVTTFSSPPPSSTAPPCDFSPWENYISHFLQRANLVSIDLEEIGAPGEVEGGAQLARSSRTEAHYFSSNTRVPPEIETDNSPTSRRTRRDVTSTSQHRKLRLNLECYRRFRKDTFFWFREFRDLKKDGKHGKLLFRRILSTYAERTSNTCRGDDIH